jgi:hypothetical protein
MISMTRCGDRLVVIAVKSLKPDTRDVFLSKEK